MDLLFLGPRLVSVRPGPGYGHFRVWQRIRKIEEKRLLAAATDEVEGEICEQLMRVLAAFAVEIGLDRDLLLVVPEVVRIVRMSVVLV